MDREGAAALENWVVKKGECKQLFLVTGNWKEEV